MCLQVSLHNVAHAAGTSKTPPPSPDPVHLLSTLAVLSSSVQMRSSERLNEFRHHQWLVRPQCLLLYDGDENYLHCKVALMTIENTRFKPLAQSNPSGEYDLCKVNISSWAPTRSLVWSPCLLIKTYHSSPLSLVLSRTQKSNFIFLNFIIILRVQRGFFELAN